MGNDDVTAFVGWAPARGDFASMGLVESGGRTVVDRAGTEAAEIGLWAVGRPAPHAESSKQAPVRVNQRAGSR
jgi:hypothetical protein